MSETNQTDNVQKAPVAEPSETQRYDAPFNVNISFPESIIIKMVDASALHDYEFGLFISSLFSTAFVGFLVAYFQTPNDDLVQAKLFGIATIIVGVVTVAFFICALMKRSKMTARTRAFKLKTGGVQEIKDE